MLAASLPNLFENVRAGGTAAVGQFFGNLCMKPQLRTLTPTLTPTLSLALALTPTPALALTLTLALSPKP